ncbi:tetratricopeptide repeat protein [Candidatus Poriferisocius sp.]|uniref:tetratricopeptide repeat protein n=1 Tax=Candidatus Poriferisocius sp. TaxID=3101276 RepID=UPI003B0179EF
MRDRRADEREFWLRSLDDLDEELAAGDLDPEDHRALSQSYARQAAQVLRGEQGRPKPPAGGNRGRRAVAVIGLVAVGVVAGVLLARAAGSRYSGDTITGNDAVTSTVGLLNDAQESLATGDRTAAIRIYDQVLQRSPANPTALAYRGWLLFLEGREVEAADSLADAVAAAPDYPDARAFRAILLYRTGDCAGAATELAALDAANPPEFVDRLVEDQGLRTRIALCRVTASAGEQSLDLAALGITAADAVAAAQALWDPTIPGQGDPVLGLRVYQAVLADHPDHAGALTFSGVVLIQTGLEDQAAEGARRLDRAVEADPDHPEARLWRAWLLIGLGRPDQARRDLDHLDTLAPPPEVSRLAADLRASL